MQTGHGEHGAPGLIREHERHGIGPRWGNPDSQLPGIDRMQGDVRPRERYGRVLAGLRAEADRVQGRVQQGGVQREAIGVRQLIVS